jgi:hypothetical protein
MSVKGFRVTQPTEYGTDITRAGSTKVVFGLAGFVGALCCVRRNQAMMPMITNTPRKTATAQKVADIPALLNSAIAPLGMRAPLIERAMLHA